MRKSLAASLVLLKLMDCTTTYIGLQSHHVMESNPVADWIFGVVGVLPGMTVMMMMTILAAIYFASRSKYGARILGVLVVVHAFVVASNFRTLWLVGLLS